MSAQASLLDKVREKCSIPSDNALAQRIGISRAAVSEWRSDQRPMPDERIAQLCAMAHIEPAEWLARLHAERAASAVERRAWMSILERLRPAAAVAGLAMLLGLGSQADAKPLNSKDNFAGTAYYVQRLRRWLATLRPRPLAASSLRLGSR